MSTILNTNRILSSGQIQDCLAVLIHACSHLRIIGDATEPSGAPRASVLDGGAKMALEATVIKVCDRIDAILADDSRWAIPDVDAQTLLLVNLTQTIKIQAEQLKQMALQTQAMEKGISIRFEHGETYNQPPDGKIDAQHE